MTTRTAYSRLQVTLHWLIAVLIVAAWWTGDGMGRALRQRIEAGDTGITGNTLHVWLGGAVFALILIRIAVRHLSGVPGAVPGTTPLMARAAHYGHLALYALMLLVPLLGATVWYGKIDALGGPHSLAANLLMIVALGHAAMAIYHQYVKKDGTLTRMTRPGA